MNKSNAGDRTTPPPARVRAMALRRAISPQGGGERNDVVFERARSLRKNSTDAERILWATLRDFKRGGLHFRRQAPIGRYIADFVCHRARLVVELDGSQHGADETVAYDAERTAFLNSRGYRVIRFWNWEVLRERSRVVDYIARMAELPPPDPAPLTLRRIDLPARGR